MISLLWVLWVVPFSSASAKEASINPVYSYPIITVPGKKITAVGVSYPPGAETGAHRHGNSFVVAYVTKGKIRSGVGSAKARVYKVGESWTELPNDLHRVSANALSDKTSSLVAIFISDEAQTELVIPEEGQKQ